jgi:hypothetical protein
MTQQEILEYNKRCAKFLVNSGWTQGMDEQGNFEYWEKI